jgi:protein-disulfide isomerase
MNRPTHFSWTLIILTLFFLSCHNEKTVASNSKIDLVKKNGDPNHVVAVVNGGKITEKELTEGIESDLFQARMKVYEIQREKLKSLILKNLMTSDPNKKGLSNDQYLEQYILKGKGTPSEAQVEAFIKERKIPATQINDHVKGRIKKFLSHQLKKDAIDNWLQNQQNKGKVQILLAKPRRPVFKVHIGDSPFFGHKNAKVTLVEFSDFQCPFCAKGADILKKIKAKYGSKVKVVFKNFPLPFHKHAQIAAEASFCAHEQGKKFFWKLHDHMFENQNLLRKDDLVAKAKGIGLKEERFKKCLESKKYAHRVKTDMDEGKGIGVKSTPTFFINGQIINGAHPLKVFTDIIDEGLK